MNQIAATEKGAARQVSQLEQLRRFTKIVADTGDYATLKEFSPQDATTNPSLIFKVAEKPEYRALLDQAIAEGRRSSLTGEKLLREISDHLLVLFGVEILKLVPGRVSTETDADLAFDTEALLAKARRFIELYQQHGIARERVLIKLATTWEGVRAAEQLQKEGINCNMTLLFSLAQAAACAQVNARLISPFVGRILDWFKAKKGQDFPPTQDPGVLSVNEIYAYYKKFGIQTEVMGASFRSKGEVLELAGCDLLTISPKLLAELKASTDPLERKLSPALAQNCRLERLQLDEKQFRWLLNEDAMATEKLAEGIRLFNADAVKLRRYVTDQLAS